MLDSQDILMQVDGVFVTERVTPRPAIGEPLQTLRQALKGVAVISDGDGESHFVCTTARGPAFRILSTSLPEKLK